MRKLLLASAATLGATLALSGGAKAQPVKPVAPGTLVVHFNGYLQFELGVEGSSYNTVNTAAGTYKLNPVTTVGDFRIYPGFDAQTVNGIEYGAATDIRTGYSDPGTGQNGKPIVTTATTTSSLSSLYVKRAYGYIGSPDFGFVRFGQTDSAFTLLQAGVIEAFGDGAQWTGEGTQEIMFPSDATPGQFIYADQTPVYATDKVVYITPAFSGLSAVVGYEPNSNGLKEGYNNDAYASSTSANLSSSPTASDIGKRRRNTIDAGLQYLDTVDGMKVKASADVLHGVPVSYTGGTALSAAPYGYDSLNVYQIGAQTTVDGITLGANVKWGQVEDSYTFKPKGARDALAYTLGASYVLGPYVLGASFFDSQSSGGYVPGKKAIARTLTEYGVAVGANYVISPNLSLFTQYEYGHRHQPGNSFGVSSVPARHGNAQVQGIGAGATIKW